MRRRKRVQPGTETTQPNVIVHGSWQLSLIALRDVTGAPYREVNSKVATAPNTQSRR